MKPTESHIKEVSFISEQTHLCTVQLVISVSARGLEVINQSRALWNKTAVI